MAMRILAGATTWLRRIIDLALIALIVAVLVAVALGKVVPFTGRQSIIIGGASMEPAIPLGSAVVVAPVDPSMLAVGDVVSMKVGAEATTYTHRIVSVVDRADGRWIRTKGDANQTLDPTLVPATTVVGRVELAVPMFGYLMALLSLPVGVVFVLGLAATLLAIAWLLESLEPPKLVTVRRPVDGQVTDPQATDWPASDPPPVRPRTITAHALVARSLAVVRDPVPLLLPSTGTATLRVVAPGAQVKLVADPPTPPHTPAPPRPRRRAEAAREREFRTVEVRRRFLRRGRSLRADPDDAD
jgi:signal peptidase